MRAQRASELFNSGKNCSQAVFATFAGDYGLDDETALKITCGLGSGVRSAEICGAVSGAVLVIGLKHGSTKELCNQKTEEFIAKFKTENGSIVCRDLLDCDISTPAGREKAISENLFKTKCLDMVLSAVKILEESGY